MAGEEGSGDALHAADAARVLGLAPDELQALVELGFLRAKMFFQGAERFARADLERVKPEEVDICRTQAALLRKGQGAGPEKRVHPRVPLLAKVQIRTPGAEGFAERFSGNISLGGVFIRTDSPLSPGTPLLLSVIDRESGNPLLEARGVVAWSRSGPGPDASEPAGMGISFTWLSPEGEAAVKGLVEGGRPE